MKAILDGKETSAIRKYLAEIDDIVNNLAGDNGLNKLAVEKRTKAILNIIQGELLS